VSRKKRMICHTYFDNTYISTREYPSISALSQTLKENGARFRASRLQNLGNNSEIIQNGQFSYEIEEGL